MSECPTPITPTPTAMASTWRNWLGCAFSESDGTPSSKRLLFALVVVYCLGLVTGALGIERTLSAQAQSILETLIWATAAAVGVSKFAEAKP